MVKSGRYEIMASGFFPLIGIAPTIQYNDFSSPRRVLDLCLVNRTALPLSISILYQKYIQMLKKQEK